MTKEKFREEILKIIEKNNILNHPFYRKWNEGKLTLEELRDYSRHYNFFVENFPMFVSAVHSNCGNSGARMMLMENLADEEGYKSPVPGHPELWRNFASALGENDRSLRNTEVYRGIRDSVNGFHELCRSRDYRIGIAALLGYEMQIPEVSRVKIEGLRKFYGIESEKAIEFFEVHRLADVEHSKAELDLLLAECTSPADQKKALSAVEKSACLYWQMLDSFQA